MSDKRKGARRKFKNARQRYCRYAGIAATVSLLWYAMGAPPWWMPIVDEYIKVIEKKKQDLQEPSEVSYTPNSHGAPIGSR